MDILRTTFAFLIVLLRYHVFTHIYYLVLDNIIDKS
jgi:hypothetical protein